MRTLQIAMLTYSVRPRGGVVHALEVARALARRGHELELMALGRPGEEFFRTPAVPTHVVRYEPFEGPFDARIEAMVERYREGLADRFGEREFDLVHCQDCISANAVLPLRALGLAAPVIRTVHHVDEFRSRSLIECQDRSIVDPDAVLCVSQPWVTRLQRQFGVNARLVRNGVDRDRWRPAADLAERARVRAAAGFGERLVVLAVGGVEPRKGSLTLLDGLSTLRSLAPERDPLLIVAGGATLFDYRDEIDRFQRRLAELRLTPYVRMLGSLPDGALERLYRAADLFAFPSTTEGFGLAALEALASELPVVASDIGPLRTFLEDGRSALLTPVGDGRALGEALARLARDSNLRDALRSGGRSVAAGYSWDLAAAVHERVYLDLLRSLRRQAPRGAAALNT